MLMAVFFPSARVAARSEAYTRTLALACRMDQTRPCLPRCRPGSSGGAHNRGGLLHLSEIDWVVMGVYFAFVLGVGYTLRRYVKTSTDYFLSGRSIPAWAAGLAFLSANLGAQEVIGMAASRAKDGNAPSHFYWVGAVPGMGILGRIQKPLYYC